jgi:hypothetical protein
MLLLPFLTACSLIELKGDIELASISPFNSIELPLDNALGSEVLFSWNY